MFNGNEKIKNIMIYPEETTLEQKNVGEYQGFGIGKDRVEIKYDRAPTELLTYLSYISISISGFLVLSGMAYFIGKILWKNCILT